MRSICLRVGWKQKQQPQALPECAVSGNPDILHPTYPRESCPVLLRAIADWNDDADAMEVLAAEHICAFLLCLSLRIVNRDRGRG